MDVTALPGPAISTAPPTPAFPGTTEQLLLNQLWPGVTYYALLISSNPTGGVSAYSNQASTVVFDAPPPPPLNLTVVETSSSSVSVSWSTVAAYDLDYYKIYFDSTPPYNFSHASTTVVFAPMTTDVIAGLSLSTYIFKVTAVDRGQPRFPGVALESIAASSVTIQLTKFVHLPQEPFGIGLASGTVAGSSVTWATMRWMATARFADMAPFANPNAPTSGELGGYTILRSSVWAPGTPWTPSAWTDMVDPSTATLSWTDLASGPQYYYHARSWNDTGVSEHSVIRSVGTGAAYVLGPDGMSYYTINGPALTPIEGVAGNPDSAYLISVSSRTQDLGTLNGRVMSSIEFDSYMGGHQLSPSFALSAPGVLTMHYAVSSSSLVTPSGFSAKTVTPTPSNMSVYWFNGVNWVQLYGRVDVTSESMTIATQFFGRYQLRSVERTGGFAFNMAGVSNRFITPNGDRRNDNVVFTFDNPRDSAVTIKIFDMRGHQVVGSLPPGPVSNSLMWDGTVGGRPAAGGVYIYQISAEGQSFSGTVVIIK